MSLRVSIRPARSGLTPTALIVTSLPGVISAATIGNAAEEMSATSEELAAQAEELQTSIAFFRTDAERVPARAQARVSTFKAPAKPAARPTPKAAPSKPAVHAQQARAKGFALDLATGGADDEDMDFRESA